jgi:predicted nucleotide-binding protein (sugar kinase/HSP70/actin superfamily)
VSSTWRVVFDTRHGALSLTETPLNIGYSLIFLNIPWHSDETTEELVNSDTKVKLLDSVLPLKVLSPDKGVNNMIVGLPRALLYYKYGTLWQSFFNELGVQTVVSPCTNRGIVEDGLNACVCEACLPIKTFFGHMLALRDKADCVFIPRYVSVHRHEFICPKFAGLPDMVRHALIDIPPILEVQVNHYNGHADASLKAAVDAGRQLGLATGLCRKAYSNALEQYRQNRARQVGQLLETKQAVTTDSNKDGPLVLLLGHAYNVLDHGMNLNLVRSMQRMGARVMTAENIDGRLLRPLCGHQEEPSFWTLGAQMLGAGYYALERNEVDGVIYLTSFGCGLDAFMEYMVARRMHEQGMPYMVLTMDEHTAEAGMITRLEAFMETLPRRKNREADLPLYGQSVYSR